MKLKYLYRLLLIGLSCSVLVSFQNRPQQKYWIFFTDKPEWTYAKSSGEQFLKSFLAKRSIKRRKKIDKNIRIDVTDIPVSRTYLKELERFNINPIIISRWLNAVSCYLADEDLKQLNEQPFVRSIIPVKAYKKRIPKTIDNSELLKKYKKNESDALYGQSYFQNDLINVIPLHDAGITGKGILVGVIDTGFNLDHDAFKDVNVIAEYDFINSDNITRNENGQDQSDQDMHGTQVLSTIAGYRVGELIGTAYDAEFALAKTEDESIESMIEEDHWVAALEWLDSLGADIVTSSLGYNIMSDKVYSKDDMNGQTAVTSIAASMAADKGILLLISAGNEGSNSWGIITSPADANDILSVGAVNQNGNIASFSSKGPTADGRIKPEIVAMGTGVYTTRINTLGSYTYTQGTSFATPIAAGAAALLLSTHPQITPKDLINIVKSTSSRGNNPDNAYGWGIMNAYEAAVSLGPVFSNTPEFERTSNSVIVYTNILSDDSLNGKDLSLYYSLNDDPQYKTVNLIQSDSTLYYAEIPNINTGYTDKIYFFFTAKDSNNRFTAFPGTDRNVSFAYNPVSNSIEYPDRRDRADIGIIPEVFKLHQNYPNPFNAQTVIEFDVIETSFVRIQVFDILGREVRTFIQGELPHGEYTFRWDGSDESGSRLPSGIYFCNVTAPGYKKTIKMLLIK